MNVVVTELFVKCGHEDETRGDADWTPQALNLRRMDINDNLWETEPTP